MKLKTPRFPSKAHHHPGTTPPSPVAPQNWPQSPTPAPNAGTGPASPLKKVKGGLASPARQRNAVVMLAGAAFIIVAAALGASVASSYDDSLEVLVAAEDIVEGQTIEASDFRPVRIAAEAGDIELVPPSAIDTLVGQVAAGPIGSGAMIHPTQFIVASDESRIILGAALKASQYPAGGLKPGDFVRLIAVAPRPGFGSEAATTGHEVGFGEITAAIPVTDTSTHYSIRVGESSANLVAQLFAEGRISLALVDKSIALEIVDSLPPENPVEPLEFTTGEGE